jgi:hypothetical protein
VATITEEQRRLLGGRSLDVALRDARQFADATAFLFSDEIRSKFRGKWVSVYLDQVRWDVDFDNLLKKLDAEEIPSEFAAIGFIE